MKRRVFVGDIQGCREELARLLDRIRFDPARDELHPVGDLVNRGPDSLGALRLLRDVDAGGVLGNHDLHLLNVASGRRAPGPKDTFQDVLAAPDRDELLHWLAARPFVREWPDLILVHAGLHPHWTRDPRVTVASRFQDATPSNPGAAGKFAVNVRYCDPDGAQPESDWPPPAPPFRPWFEYFPAHPDERRTVVFGHWARMGIVERPQVRGLDSGCVWGKALTAWIAEDDRLASVSAVGAHATHSGD